MEKLKLRSVLLGILIGVLSLYAVSLVGQRSSLAKMNRNLIEQSLRLERSMQHLRRASSNWLTLKKANSTLRLALTNSETSFRSAHEEKAYLEEMLVNKTKEIELLQKNLSDARAQSEKTPGFASASRDEEMKRLIEQNRLLQEKLNRMYKTTTAKINEINIAKIALEEIVASAKQKIDDEWNTVNLGAVSATPQRASNAKARDAGRVLAINNEHGFVVVDLGKADNLSQDATLEVTKNGEPIATLSVLEIRDVMTACNIRDIHDGQKIEVNDPVSVLR